MKNLAKEFDDFEGEVRVRFAPSPTGDLHVGGVRTALFNYLFARHKGGKFLLRIEDTDRKRSTQDAIDVIMKGLEWLSLTPNEEPVFQSTRAENHVDAAQQMMASGHAYCCFCDPEELAKKRENARANKETYRYDRKCHNLSREEVEQRLAEGERSAVRLLIPDGAVTFNDGTRGNVTIDGSEIDDFILLRRDGSPTYMLAVVVDDSDMGITHIIRGDDHLVNTPKQILIYRALGRSEPHFAHVPLILGPGKKRLSKRHGATSIEEYRESGYLPETLINYLGLLGWSPGDDRNEISREELIDLFEVGGIQVSGAVFDESKLSWLNGHYIHNSTFSNVFNELEHHAHKAVSKGILPFVPEQDKIETAFNLLKDRITHLSDLFDGAKYMFIDPIEYQAKGVRKHFNNEGAIELLEVMASKFKADTVFDTESIEKSLREEAERLEIGAGKIIHPVRLAVSGVIAGPGFFELIEALGKDVVLRRMQRAIVWIQEGNATQE